VKRTEIRRTAWMKRGTKELARGAGLARGGRIAPKHRTPEEADRIYGTPEHRAWMKRQPCVICGRTPSDAAHLTNGGTGRKDDWERSLPLCADYPDQGCVKRGHHSEYDGGKRSFRAKYAVDLEAKAEETRARWMAIQEGVGG
jgi:hypothetical protein